MLLRLHLSEYTEVAARNSVRTAKLSLQLYFGFKRQRAMQIVSNAEPSIGKKSIVKETPLSS